MARCKATCTFSAISLFSINRRIGCYGTRTSKGNKTQTSLYRLKVVLSWPSYDGVADALIRQYLNGVLNVLAEYLMPDCGVSYLGGVYTHTYIHTYTYTHTLTHISVYLSGSFHAGGEGADLRRT